MFFVAPGLWMCGDSAYWKEVETILTEMVDLNIELTPKTILLGG